MTLFASLRSRMFVASALLAIVAIGIAMLVVNVFVTRQAEGQLLREVRETAALVEQLRTTRVDTFRVQARLIADLPKLKAAVGTDDPPTVGEIAAEYRQQLNATFVLVTNAHGRPLLADLGAHREIVGPLGGDGGIEGALRGREAFRLIPQNDGLLQVVTVPITAPPDILGTLSVGFLLDDALAEQLKQTTGSDVAFGIDGHVLASTLAATYRPAIAQLIQGGRITHVRLGRDEYIAFPQPLASGADGQVESSNAVAVILRSRTEQLRFLDAIHTALGITALFVIALATVLSFAVSRTITKPLGAITDVMRDVAATGDLTRKIVPPGRGGWPDADAQLLASTFNTLTESIDRFQREMSQKERLSSLGRMSTVVAHEIRNPLMIIKAALHGLKRPEVSADRLADAVADIDEEVGRLNRIVNEVLDFARPIGFDFAPVDVNALCRESAAAAEASGPGVPIALDLDPALPILMLDPERLRQALVNMLVNARDAADTFVARSVSGADAVAPLDPVVVRTRAGRTGVSITIADRGAGIAAADLPRIFDPYFTTKRGGSGLGLAIAKNIVEGLGGAIAVDSHPGQGTDIRIEFPARLAPRGNTGAAIEAPSSRT